MLKVLPQAVYSNAGYAKCGEIFCQSATDFTIFCAFCELKLFEYEDFLRHFRNTHFQDNLLKTDNVNVECTAHPKGEHDNKEEGSSTNNNTRLDEKTETTTNTEIQLFSEYDGIIEDENEDRIAASSDSGPNTNVDDDYKPPPTKGKRKPTRHEQHNCQRCPKMYKTLKHLQKHMQSDHYVAGDEVADGRNTVQCPDCEEKFLQQRQLDLHSIEMHNGIRCTTCGKRFRQRYYLKRHQEIHECPEARTFVCDYENCTKRFLTRRRLDVHRRLHLAVKNFVCDVCGYSCQLQETLRVHYRTHTGEKPYNCAVCQKSFASSSLLNEHKAMHSTERPHICEVCGATFGRQKALYHHKYLHMGVKKFVCRICGNAYAQAAGLAGHKRKHKEEGFFG